jgi:hypothetical protein
LKKAEQQAKAKAKTEQKLNGRYNGVKLNGKHLNDRRGKSAATPDRKMSMKSGIFARPRGNQGREGRASVT